MLTLSSSFAVNAALFLLLGFSLVTWFLIFTKGWLQWQLNALDTDFRKKFWAAANLQDAERATHGNEGSLARLFRAGIQSLREIEKAEQAGQSLQMSGDRQDILERGLRQQVQIEQHRLESGLMALASVGSTAPFVGLFGTVWGIMTALQDIAKAGTAGLDVVAGPVGEALVATAIGIAVALPAVLAYNYGVRKVRLLVADHERFANDFLHLAMRTDFRLGA
ncbi:MAG: MotA/TolQ/ExbB proton channel family protein [Betaproteobacteria bacterium]|nr:MAG: MotA/TolQ/ExbB proton channel family protein [Betaproteobacteria bacterium]